MSTVMNPHALRQTIRRTFDGKLATVLGELFQNAQRSGARGVDLEWRGNVLTVRDDGHGLADVEAFHALVSLGDSHFNNPDVATFQHPMGVGFHSVLALDGVSQVTIASHTLRLTLDPSRWWTERDYYERWQDLLRTVSEVREGITMVIQGIGDEVTKCLQARDSPARGYLGILDITLNGEVVDTRLPEDVSSEPLFTFDAEGALVSVFLREDYVATHVARHFGQLVTLPSQRDERTYQYHPFHVLVDITSSYPFDFKAPVREGVIENERWRTFVAGLEDKLFETLPLIPRDKQVAYLKALHRLNAHRADGLPYIVIARPALGDIYDWLSYKGRSDERVVPVDEAPFLVDHGVYLTSTDKYASAGVESFLEALSRMGLDPWVVEAGKAPHVATLHWSPGEPFHPSYPTFTRQGTAKLVQGTQTSDVELRESDILFAVVESAYRLDDATIHIGCGEPVKAVQQVGAAAFCSESDDYDADELNDMFEESLGEVVRTFLGNALPHALSYHLLETYIRQQGYQDPKRICVVFLTATKVILRFIARKRRHRLECVLV
jgi:hypothetical protein